MNQQYLIEIAYDFLCSQHNGRLPINVFEFLDNLNIKINPCDENDILLSNNRIIGIVCAGKYSIFYNSSIKINSYLILMEFSKYLLKCNGYSSTDDQDSKLISLFIMAPPIILKELNLNTVEEISKICNVPAHITRKYINYLLNTHDPTAYDEEIKRNFKGYIKSYNHKSIADKIFDKAIEASTKLMEKGLDDPDPKLDNVRHEITEGYRISHIVYMDEQTHIYHEWDCPHIQDKIDISADCIANAEKKEYSPCPDCIRKLK